MAFCIREHSNCSAAFKSKLLLVSFSNIIFCACAMCTGYPFAPPIAPVGQISSNLFVYNSHIPFFPTISVSTWTGIGHPEDWHSMFLWNIETLHGMAAQKKTMNWSREADFHAHKITCLITAFLFMKPISFSIRRWLEVVVGFCVESSHRSID